MGKHLLGVYLKHSIFMVFGFESLASIQQFSIKLVEWQLFVIQHVRLMILLLVMRRPLDVCSPIELTAMVFCW
jgi:hypothetical protein